MIALGEGLSLSPLFWFSDRSFQGPVFLYFFYDQQKSPAEGGAFVERNTFRSLSLFRP